VLFFLSYNIPSGNAISVVPKKLNVDELTVIPFKCQSLKMIAIEGKIG
jgi:hypothetical protein